MLSVLVAWQINLAKSSTRFVCNVRFRLAHLLVSLFGHHHLSDCLLDFSIQFERARRLVGGWLFHVLDRIQRFTSHCRGLAHRQDCTGIAKYED